MKKLFKDLAVAAMVIFIGSVSAQAETFFAYLTPAQEVPTNASNATGYARVKVNESAGTLTFAIVFNNLSSNQTASHIHAPAAIGVNVGVAINFGAVGGTSGTITGTAPITPTQLSQIRAHLGYVNLHSANFPGGEIRGQLGIKRPVDFDGDGRQDYSVMRFPAVAPPGNAPITFWNLNSTTGTQIIGTFGNANTDFPTPGDFDGDGNDDLALYRDGTPASRQSEFFILKTSNFTLQYHAWGTDGDIPVARDYDGDGTTDVAIFRRGAAAGAPAFWYIRHSLTNTERVAQWGTTGPSVNNWDVPIPGDYDGDGKFDLAIYRAGTLTPTNTYIIQRSSDGTAVYQKFGDFVSDYIAPGDYDGDGKFDYAVARTGATTAAPMVWWILQSSNGQTRTQTFGISSDVPAQGDYDGDARTDIAIYRNGATAGSASNFWVLRSFDNTAQVTRWGTRGDFAVNTFDAR